MYAVEIARSKHAVDTTSDGTKTVIDILALVLTAVWPRTSKRHLRIDGHTVCCPTAMKLQVTIHLDDDVDM